MVYPQIESTAPRKLKVSPVPDRLLAVFIDFLIFSPIVSAILFQPFKDAERMYYTGPGSTEFIVYFLISFALVFLVMAFLQAVCLVQWGATPGKWICKLRVVDMHSPQQPLRLQQALLRSLAWNVEWLFLALPFLEVISHPFRRPMHDRLSDTMVVTLKTVSDPGPHILESHFVRQIVFAVFLGVLSWVVIAANHFYKLAQEGAFKRQELQESSYLCEIDSDSEKGSVERLDLGIALYLAGSFTEECLANEADFVFWSQHKESLPWANLAKAILLQFDPAKSKQYEEVVCKTDSSSEPCQLAESFRDQKLPENLQSKTAKLLAYQEAFEENRLEDAEKALSELAYTEELQSYVQKKRVMLFWNQGYQEKALGAFANTGYSKKFSELAAWLCHEELDQGCGKAKDSCHKLSDLMQSQAQGPSSSFVASAMIREKACRKTEDFPWSYFQTAWENDRSLVAYTKAISKESELTWEQREQALKAAINEASGNFRERLVLTWISMLKERGVQNEAQSWLSKNEQTPRVMSKIQAQMEFTSSRLPASLSKSKKKVEK